MQSTTSREVERKPGPSIQTTVRNRTRSRPSTHEYVRLPSIQRYAPSTQRYPRSTQRYGGVQHQVPYSTSIHTDGPPYKAPTHSQKVSHPGPVMRPHSQLRLKQGPVSPSNMPLMTIVYHLSLSLSLSLSLCQSPSPIFFLTCSPTMFLFLGDPLSLG